MNSYFKEYLDYKTLLAGLALVSIGLVSIYSATLDVNLAANFYRQGLWSMVGLIALIVAAFFPIKSLQRLSFPMYTVTLLLLAVILLLGHTVNSSKSWFGFGGMGMQPSEIAKVTTVLALAGYLSKPTVSIANVKHLVIALGIFLLPMALILRQPDLGTTIVFFVTLLPILYWAGASYFVLVAILVPILVATGALLGTTPFLVAVAIGAVVLYLTSENKFAAAVAFGITLAIGLSVQIVFEHLEPYQQKRIATFLNPNADPTGAGYNVLQSKTAIGSGGFWGKGYLHGTQTQLKYIPEQWTDFIFCVTGEEFGFVGGTIVLILYAFLLLHGLHIAGLSKNKFGSLAAVGLIGILASHLMINMGMAMGLMPVIGIPLPFLSYGGSALITSMTMLGLLMNFYAHRKEY
ncbi:MAG TPA: rod shape-determining protein RodA [Bacteroidota bacterium]|nr:rod shape-determining protein RodA [Bacteroidota bacterium]